jgi:hypothetical protein
VGLLDDIPQRANIRAQCEISKVLDTGTQLAEDLTIGIRNRHLYTAGDLEHACQRNGLPITASMIRYHRHGKCAWCHSQGITWDS